MGRRGEIHGKSGAIGEPERHFLPSRVDRSSTRHNIQAMASGERLTLKPLRQATTGCRQR